jgi:hypothetical protein
MLLRLIHANRSNLGRQMVFANIDKAASAEL